MVRYGGGTILEVIQWKTIKFKIEFSYMSRQIIRPRHAIHCNVHPIHFCQTLVSDADSDLTMVTMETTLWDDAAI